MERTTSLLDDLSRYTAEVEYPDRAFADVLGYGLSASYFLAVNSGAGEATYPPLGHGFPEIEE